MRRSLRITTDIGSASSAESSSHNLELEDHASVCRAEGMSGFPPHHGAPLLCRAQGPSSN